MKKLLFFAACAASVGLSSCHSKSNPVEASTGDPNLVAWYKLDQNAADSSGAGHDGVAQGGSYFPGRDGSAQSAFYLDGTSFISVANTASMNFDSSSSYSLSAWVKTSASATSGVVGKGPLTGALPGYSIGLINGAVEAQVSSIDNIDLLSNAKVNDNAWHMLTLTVDSHGGIILYVDGAADQKVLSLGMFPDRNNTAPFFIGKDRTSKNFFTGSIDDVRLYNKTLTSAEVIELYGSSPIDTSSGAGNYGSNTLDSPGFSNSLPSSTYFDGTSSPPWQVAYGSPWIGAGFGADGATKGYLYMWGTADDGGAVWEPLSTPIKKGQTYHVKCMLKISSSLDVHNTPYGVVRFVAFNQPGSGIPWQTSPGQISSLGSITVSKFDSWDPYKTLDWTADADYSNFAINVQNGSSGAGAETWVRIDDVQLQKKQ